MKVIYIRPLRDRGYLSIGFSNGEEKLSFSLSEGEYRELGSLLIGDETDDIEPFIYCDKKYKARRYALRILEYGDNSESLLKKKLIMKKIPRDIADIVVREMVSLGFVNERRQLERMVESLANKSLFGRRKILARLISKGYSKSRIYEVIEHLISHGVIDFQKTREALIEKKLSHDASDEEIRELMYKYGYEYV